jgi:hypothetical protein
VSKSKLMRWAIVVGSLVASCGYLAPVVSLAAEDCRPYDPKKLKIVDEGETGWVLTDGDVRMLVLDNERDAEQALALAKRHTSQCFIGRDNKRDKPKNYIMQYWKGNSGIKTDLGKEDSLPYSPKKLKIVDEGETGWMLTDGDFAMCMFDNERDAKQALALAKKCTSHCFIGRNNGRSNRKDYLVEYWK